MVTTGIPTSCCELHCKQLWVTASSTYFWIGKRLLVTKGGLSLMLSLAAQDVAEQYSVLGRTLFSSGLDWAASRCHLFLSYFLCMCFFDTNNVCMIPLIMCTLQVMFLNAETGTVVVHNGQCCESCKDNLSVEDHGTSVPQKMFGDQRTTSEKHTKRAGPYHRNMMPGSAPLLGFDLFLLITSPISILSFAAILSASDFITMHNFNA